MTERYAHLRPDHLQGAVRALDQALSGPMLSPTPAPWAALVFVLAGLGVLRENGFTAEVFLWLTGTPGENPADPTALREQRVASSGVWMYVLKYV